MVLCVTGPMAAGKNAASRILEQMGFASLDADCLVHKAVELAKEEILAEFGAIANERDIPLLNPDGSVNRRNLGAIVFSDKGLLARQERLVFPYVQESCAKFIEENENSVLNATVLYKIPVISLCDLVLFVDAPKFLRLFRARRRDKMPLRQILGRFRAQKKLFAKYRASNADTYRVWNAGNLPALKRRIEHILSLHCEVLHGSNSNIRPDSAR